jgi:hypothetical protein
MATKAQIPTNPFTALPLADYANQAREQWLSSIKQTQELALGAAKAFADMTKSLPIPDLGVSLPTPLLGTVVTFAYDLATEALAAQRDFAYQVADLFKPATPAAV